MKYSVLILMFLFNFILLKGQSDSTEYFNENNVIKTLNKPSVRINASTFGGFYNNLGYFGSSIAPTINYNLTNKFSIQTGVIFNSVNFSKNISGSDVNYYNNTNGLYYFVNGKYNINNKIFITGGLYSKLDCKNNLNKAYSNDIKGGKFGVGYNINDNSSLYFEIQLNKGNYPFNNFNTPLFNNNIQQGVIW